MESIEKVRTGRTGFEVNRLIRNQRIEIQASPTEYEILENLTIKNNYNSIASYIREVALEGPPLQGTKKTRTLERKKLSSDLGRVGSNINQIAKTINQHILKSIVRGVDPNELIALLLQSDIAQIKSDLADIKKALLKK
ncbi:plasmid mobilization protein [Methylotenera sp. N17]|uniref:plasmid mobilization protein n=1 Tax=Methylotenera sp. N17 TaxID=1502761 RepID=UPI0006462B36|nr:plasmid mobilization relaxosome protein MobC [Methylotenera sp. N17]